MATGKARRNKAPGGGRRAARAATLITAAAVLLLLSRSEIRKTLLATPAALPLLVLVVWGASFLLTWMRWRRPGEAGG